MHTGGFQLPFLLFIDEGANVNPCEKLLGMAKKLQLRGEPIPIDMLAEADELGLCLDEFDQPVQHIDHEGEYLHGIKKSTLSDT